VHCACNTVQLLPCCPLRFSWTMPPRVRAECIDYKIQGVIQQREYESWAKKIEEITQLVEFWQCTNTAFEWKMQFSCFPVFPGSAEAQVIWGGIVKRLLIGYFIGNISAKKISKSVHMCQRYSKPKVYVFEKRCRPSFQFAGKRDVVP